MSQHIDSEKLLDRIHRITNQKRRNHAFFIHLKGSFNFKFSNDSCSKLFSSAKKLVCIEMLGVVSVSIIIISKIQSIEFRSLQLNKLLL